MERVRHFFPRSSFLWLLLPAVSADKDINNDGPAEKNSFSLTKLAAFFLTDCMLLLPLGFPHRPVGAPTANEKRREETKNDFARSQSALKSPWFFAARLSPVYQPAYPAATSIPPNLLVRSFPVLELTSNGGSFACAATTMMSLKCQLDRWIGIRNELVPYYTYRQGKGAKSVKLVCLLAS